jgi:hypothetical protein
MARLLLLPPLRRVHPPPRTSLSISCRVHKPVVNQARLPHQVLLGKNQHLKLDRTTVTVGAPRILAIRPVPPRQAPPPAPLRVLPLPQQQQRVPCSPEQQGAGAPSALRALRQWGLGCDYQLPPPPCPTHLRRSAQRARKAASPASKETSSSTHEPETSELDYTTQDGLPLGTWSP